MGLKDRRQKRRMMETMLEKPGGQMPPRRPPIDESPLLMPPSEPRPVVNVDDAPPLDPTMAQSDVRALADSLSGRGPPPIPQSERPSEIKSNLLSFQTRFQMLKSSDQAEGMMDAIRKLQEEVQGFLRQKAREEGHKREELEEVNRFLKELDDNYRQIMDHVTFKANQAAAQKQPSLAPLPIESPSPVPSVQAPVEALPSIQMDLDAGPQEESRPSAFRRFLTSPVTWAVTYSSAFTAVMLWKKAFQDLAGFIGKVLHTKPPSVKLTMAVYGAVSAGVLAVTVLINYLRNRKAEKREETGQQQNGGPTEYS